MIPPATGAGRGMPPGPAGQTDLRGHNLALITRLLGSSEPMSRAEIASRTGLGRATVSRLTQELLDARLVRELPPVGTDQRGRPATPLGLAAGTVVGIGLEVNVWYIAGRALDLAGDVHGEFRLPGDFASRPAAETLQRVGAEAVRLVHGLQARGVTVAGAELAIPGMMSVDGQQLAVAPNLGWQELRPLELLGEEWTRLGIPTLAHNDANLQAVSVAYRRPGHLVEHASFLYIAGDIGIGGAVVRAGGITTGEHGWAGEIGHVSVEPDGARCHCGSDGCLETYAGQASLMRAVGLPPDAGVDALIAQLRTGSETVLQTVERAGWALGVVIANVLNIDDLSLVILGTSLGRLLPWLDAPLRAQLDRRVLGARSRRILIEQGSDLNAPACSGGALAVLNPLVADPAAYLDRPDR